MEREAYYNAQYTRQDKHQVVILKRRELNKKIKGKREEKRERWIIGRDKWRKFLTNKKHFKGIYLITKTVDVSI